jgi:XisH protein
MPAYDTFHDAVKRGLIKEGWTITDDPLMIEFGLLNVYIDLAAERLIAAERENQRIAVEIKSFLGPSLLTDFHSALGRFLNYRIVLRTKDPGRTLFLAVPLPIYYEFFSHLLVQEAVRDFDVHLIVYDPEQETLERWVT